MRFDRFVSLLLATFYFLPYALIAQQAEDKPTSAGSAPGKRQSGASPVVSIHPDGKLFLRAAGLGVPVLPQPIEAKDLTAERLKSTMVTIETVANTPMEHVQKTIELLQAAGATSFMMQSARSVPEEPQLKVIQLAHSAATELANQLQIIYPEKATIVADQRTNSIIMRGSDKVLLEIEALALRLDADGRPRPGAASLPHPVGMPMLAGDPFNSPARVSKPRGEYDRHQQRAQQLAGQLQQAPNSERAELRQQLRQEVEAAFDVRQQEQQAEFAQLRARLAKIEQSIAARQTAKDTIVEARVAELLDPSLRWESPQTSAAIAGTPIGVSAPPATARSAATTNPLGLSTTAQATPGREPTTTPRRGPVGGTGNTLILRSAEDFGRELIEAEIKVEHMRKLADKGFAPQSALMVEERRLKTIQSEYQAQLKLLDLELQNAELGLQSARAELARTEKLVASGSVSVTEVDRQKLSASQAQLRLEQIKTLLKLYQESGKSEDANRNPASIPDLEKP